MLLTVYITLSVIGLIVSAYLTLYNFKKTKLYCPVGKVINCKTVIEASPKILGIQAMVFGIPFFLIEIILAIYGVPISLLLYNLLGLIYVFWFISIEWSVKRICLYCTTVHITVILLFLILLLALLGTI